MLMVAKVKKPENIPAVTHVDGTGRLQTVSKDSNPLYYELINQFYKVTGIPVIINTSMNVMGEPIVNTPEQAYSMIIKTDMDYLMMGNYMISKIPWKDYFIIQSYLVLIERLFWYPLKPFCLKPY